MFGGDMIRDLTSDEVVAAGSREADHQCIPQVRGLVSRLRPEGIVLIAASADVDGSEKNPDLTFAVNARCADSVARAASEFGARLLYISAEWVFAGSCRKGFPLEANPPQRVCSRN
jgi:dTDP-4-dehydrorhamnose reductase